MRSARTRSRWAARCNRARRATYTAWHRGPFAMHAPVKTDANDILRKMGIDGLRNLVDAGKPFHAEVVTNGAVSKPEQPFEGLRVIRAADIAPQPIEWVWPGRIARGKLTLIAGEPGLGKSQVTCEVAA